MSVSLALEREGPLQTKVQMGAGTGAGACAGSRRRIVAAQQHEGEEHSSAAVDSRTVVSRCIGIGRQTPQSPLVCVAVKDEA